MPCITNCSWCNHTALNNTKHKRISTDTTVMMRGLNLTIKHYMVTKNHITTHTVLL